MKFTTLLAWIFFPLILVGAVAFGIVMWRRSKKAQSTVQQLSTGTPTMQPIATTPAATPPPAPPAKKEASWLEFGTQVAGLLATAGNAYSAWSTSSFELTGEG